ncbi:MAG: PHP domain-containing protein [Dehalococcoidia bacterium]|jgi:predicted metal-dependent phosphoesterase TrpH
MTLKADLHLHTNYSPDSLITPEGLVARCLKIGINCIAVTDHNALDGALAVQSMAPFRVIAAEEIKTTEGEVIGFFLRERISPGLSPEETVRQIKTQGGLVGVPHPFDRLRREPLRQSALERVLPQIDIIEAFNARVTVGSDNARAAAFAAEHGLTCSAGSDAHSLLEVGRACVEMDDFETPQEFLESLRKGKIDGKCSSPLVHAISTWAKLRRRLGRR